MCLVLPNTASYSLLPGLISCQAPWNFILIILEFVLHRMLSSKDPCLGRTAFSSLERRSDDMLRVKAYLRSSWLLWGPYSAMQRYRTGTTPYCRNHKRSTYGSSFNFMWVCHFGLLAYRFLGASFFEFSSMFWRRYLQSEWNRRKIEADSWISHYYDSTSV